MRHDVSIVNSFSADEWRQAWEQGAAAVEEAITGGNNEVALSVEAAAAVQRVRSAFLAEVPRTGCEVAMSYVLIASMAAGYRLRCIEQERDRDSLKAVIE